jgi:hypothetical protein
MDGGCFEQRRTNRTAWSPLASVADQAGALMERRESGQGDSVARPECSIPRCVAPHRQEFVPTAVARRHTPCRPIGSPSLTNRSRIERCSTRPGEPHPRGDDVIARGTGRPDRTANRRRRNGDKAIRASARPAPSGTLTQSRQRRRSPRDRPRPVPREMLACSILKLAAHGDAVRSAPLGSRCRRSVLTFWRAVVEPWGSATSLLRPRRVDEAGQLDGAIERTRLFRLAAPGLEEAWRTDQRALVVGDGLQPATQLLEFVE